MEINDERIRNAVKNTLILRPPKQNLYTFGTTNIYYYMVTEPVYADMVQTPETVVREGRVIAERPRIVTPYYLSRLDGFSVEARRYFDHLVQKYGANIRGLFYTYKNEPKEMNIVSDSMRSVVDKLNSKIDLRNDPLAAIIKGEDELWDVSLMKFIQEVTRRSAEGNLRQMNSQGLLNEDATGTPADARMRIDELFQKVEAGETEPGELKDELERWGLFKEYEDRFFDLFHKKR